MKKILAAILCLTLLTGLCACGAPPEETQGTSPAQTEQIKDPEPSQTVPAEPETLEIPEIPAQDQQIADIPQSTEQWIFTNYDQTFIWQDPQGERHTMTVVLPALAPAAEFAVRYNASVSQLGQLLLEEVEHSWEKGYYPSTQSLTYKTYTSDDVLFIIMERRMTEGYSMLYVDAFDLEECKQLYAGQVTEALADMDYPTFILAVTELTRQQYIRTYEPIVTEIEAGTYTGSDSYFITEPNQMVADYYHTLDRLPYLTLYISQARMFVDESGALLLSLCIPETDGMDSTRMVIPFDAAALGWSQMPSDDRSYGYLLDIQHYVDGIHADAWSIMLTEAFFSDPEEFVEHAAVESRDSITRIIGQLKYNLYGDALTTFIEECNRLLSDDDMTAHEQAFVNAALAEIQ